MRGLEPNKTYLFDLVSGGQTEDNGGAHYTAATGPRLPASGGRDILTTRILNPNGQPASDAIVILRLKNPTDASGANVSQDLAAPSPTTRPTISANGGATCARCVPST